jgi:hypothetical protein
VAAAAALVGDHHSHGFRVVRCCLTAAVCLAADLAAFVWDLAAFVVTYVAVVTCAADVAVVKAVVENLVEVLVQAA